MSKIEKLSTVPYTSNDQLKFEWIRTEWNPHWWSFVVNRENIVLKQIPSESLNMKVIFDCVKSKHYCEENDGSIYEATITLMFQNNLHEFSQHYVYEIICETYRDDQQTPECLFSMFETRKTNYIDMIKMCFLDPKRLNSQNLCFYIRRHNHDFYRNNIDTYVDFKSMCQDMPTDINLLVGGDIIPAHKFILSYRSDVFKAMFASEMTENKDGVVNVEKFDLNIIREMVNFIYTGEVENIEGIRYQLYEAAHQYQIDDLCHVCIEYIVFNSNCENIAETLELANLYDIEKLKKRALNFLNNHTEEVIKEPSYQVYMCRSIKLDNVVSTLLTAKKYNIQTVCVKALDFIGQTFSKMKDNEEFLKLFESDPHLTREIVLFYCEKYAPTANSY